MDSRSKYSSFSPVFEQFIEHARYKVFGVVDKSVQRDKINTFQLGV